MSSSTKVMTFRVPLGCPPGSPLPVITPEGIPLIVTVPHNAFSWQDISISYSVSLADYRVPSNVRNLANKTVDITTPEGLKMQIILPPEAVPGCKVTVPYTKVKLPFVIPATIPPGPNPTVLVMRPDGQKMAVPISPRAYPGQLSSALCAVAGQSPEHYTIDTNPEPEPEPETLLSGAISLLKPITQLRLRPLQEIMSVFMSPHKDAGAAEHEEEESAAAPPGESVGPGAVEAALAGWTAESAAGVSDSSNIESDVSPDRNDPSSVSSSSQATANRKTPSHVESILSSVSSVLVSLTQGPLSKHKSKPSHSKSGTNSGTGGVDWRNAPVALPEHLKKKDTAQSFLPSFLTGARPPRPPTAMSLAQAAGKAPVQGKDSRGFLSGLVKRPSTQAHTSIQMPTQTQAPTQAPTQTPNPLPENNKPAAVNLAKRAGPSGSATPSAQDTQRRPQRRPS